MGWAKLYLGEVLLMRGRWFFLAALLVGCGGGGGGGTATVPGIATSTSSTVSIPQAGGTIVFPSYAGFGGTSAWPAPLSGGSSSLTITVQTNAPTNVPTLSQGSRRPLGRGLLSAVPVPSGASSLFYFSFAPSAAVSLPSAPSFTMTLSSAALTGESYFLAVYDPTQSPASWKIFAGPAQVNGSTLTFASQSSSMTLAAGQTYWFAVYDVPEYTDWTSFGFDIQRTGYNPNERTINANNVSGLHVLWSIDLGEKVTAQPVLAANVTTSTGSRNMLYVGAENGIFYGIDADAGQTVWSKQLGAYGGSGCLDLLGSPYGISGAAAIDRATSRVYVADGADRVYALNLADGTTASGWPVQLPALQYEDYPYSGLAFNPANQLLYVSTAAYCDYSPWHGQIDAINTQSATIAGTFYPSATQYGGPGSGGGIWGPVAAAIDAASNDVFVGTGNSDGAVETAGYGENVVRLSANVASIKAAYTYKSSGLDSDFGSSTLLFQPHGCNAMVAIPNKDGNILEFQRDAISSGPVQLFSDATAASGKFIGNVTYSPVTNLLYYGSYTADGNYFDSGLTALSVNSGCTLKKQWTTPVTTVPPSFVYVLSPASVASGVVYWGNGFEGEVFAFDATSGAALWNSGSTINGAVFAQPLIDKHLFVSSWDHKLYCFGL